MGHPSRLSPAGECDSPMAAAPLARLPLARDGLSKPDRESAEEGPLRDELTHRVHLGKPDPSCSRFKDPLGSLKPPSPVPETFLRRASPAGAFLPPWRRSLCGAGNWPSGRCVSTNKWLDGDFFS